MDNGTKKDKLIIDEILEEIQNLKKYSKQLNDNTRGEKLENYIDNLSKNINQFEDKVEEIYEENYRKIETIE